MKSVLDEFAFDSLLVTEEWHYVQYHIQEALRTCETLGAFDANAFPFVSYFESEIKKQLIKAGFKEEILDDPEQFELVMKDLERQASVFIDPIWHNPPHAFPEGTFTVSEDHRTFWANPDIEGSLRSLQGARKIKHLLRDAEAVKIYLYTMQFIVNVLRSGRAPELARVEADKLDNSRWSREVKKIIMQRAIQRIFERFPNMPKTLGHVWNKFNVVNAGEPFIVANKDTRSLSEKYFIK